MVINPQLHCFRCLYDWWRRKPELPKTCPKCHSPYWATPRTVKKEDNAAKWLRTQFYSGGGYSLFQRAFPWFYCYRRNYFSYSFIKLDAVSVRRLSRSTMSDQFKVNVRHNVTMFYCRFCKDYKNTEDHEAYSLRILQGVVPTPQGPQPIYESLMCCATCYKVRKFKEPSGIVAAPANAINNIKSILKGGER